MKRFLSVILLLILCVAVFSSCSKPEPTKEDKLIGYWRSTSENETVTYAFEKNDNRVYVVSRISESKDSGKETAVYEYSVENPEEGKSCLIFKQDEYKKTCEYRIEGDALYIENVKYDKYAPGVGGNEGDKLTFTPENFVKNLGYMGSGMLGIFVVIGIIVTITYILNAVTRKK